MVIVDHILLELFLYKNLNAVHKIHLGKYLLNCKNIGLSSYHSLLWLFLVIVYVTLLRQILHFRKKVAVTCGRTNIGFGFLLSGYGTLKSNSAQTSASFVELMLLYPCGRRVQHSLLPLMQTWPSYFNPGCIGILIILWDANRIVLHKEVFKDTFKE